MYFLTWHGTLLGLTEAGLLAQARLGTRPWPQALQLDDPCRPGTAAHHPVLGRLDVSAGVQEGSVALGRPPHFLSAVPDGSPPAFDRTRVASWESLLSITPADLDLLVHLHAQRWLLRETRTVIPRRGVALLSGFRLALGDMQVELARFLPSRAPANREAGPSPDTLFASLPDGAEVALCVAHPRHSQLVDTATWPVRARRQAEMMALAAHRFVLGHEPSQEALEAAATRLVENRGAVGLLDLLEDLAVQAAPSGLSVPIAHAPLAVPHAAPSDAPTVAHAGTPLEAAQEAADRGQPRAAMAMLERLANITPDDAQVWDAIGALCRAEGEYAAAEAAYRRCLAIEPAHVEAATALGGLLASLGRRLDAVALYTRLLEARPDAGEARAQLAALYVDLRWRDCAEAVLAAPETGALTGWKAAVQTRNRDAMATLRHTIASFQQAHDAGTLGWPARVQFIEHLFLLGELARCDAMVDAAIAIDPGKPAPYEVRARLLMRRSGIDAAIAYMRPLESAIGHARRLSAFVANLLLEAGRFDEARAALEPHARQAGTPDARQAGTPEIYVTLMRAAIWLDDRGAVSTLARAWMAIGAHESTAPMYALVDARFAGRVRRLNDLPEAAAPLEVHVVQYWHSAEIPADVADAMASWSFHNPGIGHTVFDDTSARDYLVREFGGAGPGGPGGSGASDAGFGDRLLACFDAARHPAMRSDLFRLAYLSRQGGVYVDADEVCRRDMRGVFAHLTVVELIGWIAPNAPPYLFNGFIAVRPGSSIVQQALIEAVRLLSEHAAAGIQSDIWQVTGPGLLTRAVARHPGPVLLLTDGEFRHFARTDEMLAYKHADGGNWRVA